MASVDEFDEIGRILCDVFGSERVTQDNDLRWFCVHHGCGPKLVVTMKCILYVKMDPIEWIDTTLDSAYKVMEEERRRIRAKARREVVDSLDASKGRNRESL